MPAHFENGEKCDGSKIWASQGRTLGGCGGGGETPPPQIFSESFQNFCHKRKVGPWRCLDLSWIVRVQVGPTSKCFRQRSVHDDGWKFYKQCSTVIGRVVLSQSRRWHLKNFPRHTIAEVPSLRLGKAIMDCETSKTKQRYFLPKRWSKCTVESCWKCSKFPVWHWSVDNGRATEGSSMQFAPRV